MGKEGKQQHQQDAAQQIEHPIITRPTPPGTDPAGTGHIPPDSEEMKKGHSLLGRGVRACLGRMQTVVLSNYDLVTDTYWGGVENANPAEGDEAFQDGQKVSGLRRYPYAARPDYAFQFVLPGEDESVLVNIAKDNQTFRHGGTSDGGAI